MNKNKFFESLINATDKKQVEQILKLNQKFYGTRYVDDDDNNEGGIEVLGNAVSGFAERCTNMFNANILFKVQKKGMEKQLQGKSARKAVELLYDVPDGRMSNMNASSKEYKDLSDMSMVILEDSDKATQPTVTFRDSGIGIKGSDFSKSILKLRGTKSRDISYLTGRFGMGGSTALSFSSYTIIASKPAFINNNEVYYTIVITEINSFGKSYKYIVDPATNNPFIINKNDLEFSHGTFIKHINFELGYTKAFEYARDSKNSMKFSVNNKMWDMILPIHVHDKRQVVTDQKEKRASKTGRPHMRVTGHKRILDNKQMRYKSTMQVSIPVTESGKLKTYSLNTNVYVLNHPELTKADTTSGKSEYVTDGSPMLFTLNGLNQGGVNVQKLYSRINFEYLRKYLIIEVETDTLPAGCNSAIYKSSRDGLKKTDFVEDVFSLVTESLASSEELYKINKEYFQYNIQNVDNTTLSDKVNKVLKKLLNNSGFKSEVDGDGMTGKKGRKTGGGGDYTPAEDTMNYPDTPTYFKILQTDVEVQKGKTCFISIETDASKSKLDDLFRYNIDSQNASYVGMTHFANGKTKVKISLDDKSEIGQKFVVTMGIGDIDQDYVNLTIIDSKGSEGEDDSSESNSFSNITPNVLFKTDEKWSSLFGHDSDNSFASVEGSIITLNGENKHRRSFNKTTKNNFKNEDVVNTVMNNFDVVCFIQCYLLFNKLDECFEGMIQITEGMSDINVKSKMSENIPLSVQGVFDVFSSQIKDELKKSNEVFI